ncbi:hypothetical protein ANN_18859 [Periplaneta americana]|uniref:HTH CENPB-type domain-containing protein n=1 Tax=Periplaneta americana TaxID=6978 RepID=A0ABQ8SPX5_PERAM|nr:hypothetical protein ANN_18859 [Periplaneta americana]
MFHPDAPVLKAAQDDYKTGKKSEGVYGKWKEEHLQLALVAISEGLASMRLHEGIIYPVPPLKDTTKGRMLKLDSPSGHPLDLPQEVENDLVTYLLQLEKMFYGLTRRSVMQLAYEIAEKNKLATRFNKETKSAGKEWFSGFMKRHPELSLRQPEATSLARASGFNRVVVGKFFDTLEQLVDQHKLTAARIFNMDETSHTVVQRQEKILAQRGKHQVGAISSCERGQNVTGVYVMNASGFFVPPMLIYARKEMVESLTFGAPPNTIFRCQDKGWMDSDTFYGHSSHTQSLKAIEICRQYGVIMLSLPSHCTHRLQPLDVSFFKPLNTFMSAAISTKMRELPGQRLNVQYIGSLVGVAFPRAANMQIAMNGFRHTGLWPDDRNVFSEADFAPSLVTDRSLNGEPPASASRAAEEVEGATTAASAEKKMGDNVELLSGLTEYVSVKEISKPFAFVFKIWTEKIRNEIQCIWRGADRYAIQECSAVTIRWEGRKEEKII